MKSLPFNRFAIVIAAVLGIGIVAPAAAQGTGNGGGPVTDTDSGTATGPDGAAGQVPKAQRKAARKEARTKKNAELKTLENNGYQPERNDLHYPQGLQKAEKKSGKGAAATE